MLLHNIKIISKPQIWITVCTLLVLVSCDLFSNESGMPINENIWVNGFLASSQHNPESDFINSGKIKSSEIDWNAITHLTYFALRIDRNGTPAQTFDPAERRNFSSDHLNSIVSAAQANNTKILFSVGGANNNQGFSSAISDTNQQQFIDTINSVITDYGFDGVNLVLVPTAAEDYINYTKFVVELSKNFDKLKTNSLERPLITAISLKGDSLLALHENLQDYFSQINILTYEMVRPFRGWQAWHNSALYNEKERLENSLLLPSVNQTVDKAIEIGLQRKKLGIAISFYSYLWESVNFKEQWATWPSQDMSIFRPVSYSELKESQDLSKSIWDDVAKVPYLDTENPKSFITFENEKSVQKKTTYAMKKRIGGVMIWDLGGGYLPNSNGIKDPLLKSIKETVLKNGN